jgi:thioredoxin reductase (NADPH)
VCDAAFYRDKVTYVVGGGDAAMEDALALTKFAKSVTVIHRRDSFKASKIMQERVLSNDKVTVMWNSAIKEVKGDQKVTGIVVDHDGKTEKLPADGVFVAIGHRPVTDIFKGQIDLDAHGYVINRQSADAAGVAAAQAALTDKGLVAFPTMTSVEGVFVAGDVADVRYKQAITAAGQGCMAALDAERWLEE